MGNERPTAGRSFPDIVDATAGDRRHARRDRREREATAAAAAENSG
ncbi:hypothetical protein KBZ10_25910 [Streptomyces sp. F63]|nr:hypothetical protein [Streptomyces sp. F63]MBQ0987891.1 hypothetical protein [Streptomyces sp. F63]